ncbi:RN180 ligase, partial [Probosciger aterrimus]|nr:RN180 ligase [Probosciger aterrimus]
MSNQEADVLRCWRCRKYIANSVCLAKSHKKEPSNVSVAYGGKSRKCSERHIFEALLRFAVLTHKGGAQWTIGKLHCPFCEARLGGFNFICNKKCSCGQLVNIHFCKSRTDCQPAFSIKLTKSPGKHLPLLKIHSGFSKDACHEVVTAALEIKNQGLSCMARNNNSTGRLTEALCLEVRAPSFKRRSKTFPLNQRRSISAFYPMNDECTIKPFNRRSHSLDLSIRERLVLSPALYETIYYGQNKNPPVYTGSDLQLESNRKDVSTLQDLSSSSADKLQKRFQVTSFTTLLHKETESEYDFEATGQSSGNATADGSPFVMNLSSPTSAVAEEQYITPVDLVQPMSISFNQRLSKREKNKLKSLRRKQRKRERWLQKQTANDNLHTDDEHDLRGDKESYLCAVCLDVYFNPYMCYPCHHIFCEPCLRMLAKDNPASTPCPLCRTTIARVFFQAEIKKSNRFEIGVSFKMSIFLSKFNLGRVNFFSQSHCFYTDFYLLVCFSAGFQRRPDTVTRRHFPHAAHRMDYMDFEDDSRVWRFDMDMVIIYIYSVNWVIGFIVFCFLCYFFFPF